MDDTFSDIDKTILMKVISNYDNDSLAFEEVLTMCTKSTPSNLIEIIEVFNDSESNLLWCCSKLVASSLIQQLQLATGNNTSKLQEIVSKLTSIGHLASSFINVNVNRPKSLIDSILLLSNEIVHNSSDNIRGWITFRTCVGKLCEEYCVKQQLGHELIIPSLLQYLMLLALDPKPHDVTIKKLFSVRALFMQVDLSSMRPLIEMILRCFVAPTFLKLSEGQKFLSFLVTRISIGVHMFEPVIKAIKSQIRSGIKSVSTSYGIILNMIWQDTVDDADFTSLMEDCIQNFVNDAIHTPDSKYFRGVRSLLYSFQSLKRTDLLDSFLMKVYRPILWRSLQCANAIVRAQASLIFFDIFPLQDETNSNAEESDLIMQKQFDMISALLKDDDQRVRANSVTGVCRILNVFWESMPPTTIKSILAYIVQTLGFDSSSAAVRHAVFSGINSLFSQPLAHGILLKLLPLMKSAIHDVSERVRIAFINILCQVKDLRDVHFYDIISPDDLICRLDLDCKKPAVCMELCKLLLNSYYPRGDGTQVMTTEQSNRCIQLIQKSISSACAFYGSLNNMVSVGSVTKLAVTLLVIFLHSSNESSKKHNSKENDEKMNESCATTESGTQKTSRTKRGRNAKKSLEVNNTSIESNNENDYSSLDFKTRFGLLQVILVLLKSIEERYYVEIHTPSKELLLKYFSRIEFSEFLQTNISFPSKENIHLLPQLIEISAIISNIIDYYNQQTNNDNNNSNNNSTLFSFDMIINNIDIICQLTNDDNEKNSIIIAIVNGVIKSNQQMLLLNIIYQSFQSNFHIDMMKQVEKIIVKKNKKNKASKKSSKNNDTVENDDVDNNHQTHPMISLEIAILLLKQIMQANVDNFEDKSIDIINNILYISQQELHHQNNNNNDNHNILDMIGHIFHQFIQSYTIIYNQGYDNNNNNNGEDPMNQSLSRVTSILATITTHFSDVLLSTDGRIDESTHSSKLCNVMNDLINDNSSLGDGYDFMRLNLCSDYMKQRIIHSSNIDNTNNYDNKNNNNKNNNKIIFKESKDVLKESINNDDNAHNNNAEKENEENMIIG
eukprot:gene8302-11233_t